MYRQRNGTRTVTAEAIDLPSPEDTQIIEDRYISRDSKRSKKPSDQLPACTERSYSTTDSSSTPSVANQQKFIRIHDHSTTSGVPTYPAVPKLQFLNVTDAVHQSHALTMSRRKPLPKSSQNELTPTIEPKPPFYRPASAPPLRTTTLINDTEEDTVHPCSPLSRPSSRASTMNSLVSAKSHTEPGPIHIHPSSQLQSMQSIGELDARLHEVASLRNSLRMTWPSRTSSDATPTGTPESISNVPLSGGVYEAHSRLNGNIRSKSTERVYLHDWARSSEWVQPSATDESSKEWIEDFLARQEQANRDVHGEGRRLGKQDSKYGSIRSRVGSIDKFRRKLSMRRVTDEQESFEARQERRHGRVFDLDIESSPYGRAIVPIPGEDLERPAISRAFSRNSITNQHLRPETAMSNRSSWAPASSSALHSTHAPEPHHMSLPSRWPSSYPTCSTFTPNPYHSTPKQRPKVKKHRYQTHGYGYQSRGYQSHGRTGSWEKLKVKAVTSIGSDLKRSISTGVAPVITEGKDSVKNLVDKVERAGGSMTRKFSASLKDKLKAFGKKKESMNVGGTYAVQRER